MKVMIIIKNIALFIVIMFFNISILMIDEYILKEDVSIQRLISSQAIIVFIIIKTAIEMINYSARKEGER